MLIKLTEKNDHYESVTYLSKIVNVLQFAIVSLDKRYKNIIFIKKKDPKKNFVIDLLIVSVW